MVKNNICVLTPSRGRPGNVKALNESIQLTTTGNVDFLVCVDSDDEKLDEYSALGDITIEVGPRLRLGGTLNAVAPRLAKEYDYIFFAGDDHRFRTPGWASVMTSEIESMGGWGICYGNDLLQGERLPTAVMMSSYIVSTLGYMVPPGLIHLFHDNYYLELGKRAGRIKYLPEVVIEHMHPLVGKADSDAGYVEVNSPATWAHDEAVYSNYLTTQIDKDVEKLLNG